MILSYIVACSVAGITEFSAKLKPVLEITPDQKRKSRVRRVLELTHKLLSLSLRNTRKLRTCKKRSNVCRQRVERFGLKRFMGSDKYIRFFTGLPIYKVFLCLFNFIQPLLGHLYLTHSDKKHIST